MGILHAGVVIATLAQLQKCWFFSGAIWCDAAELATEMKATEPVLVLVLWRLIVAIYTYE